MRWQLILALSISLAIPSASSASDAHVDGLYLSLGPSFGGHFRGRSGEALLGAEATLVRLKSPLWWGWIADGRLIADEELLGLTSMGLEVGRGSYGINAAPVLAFTPDGLLPAGQIGFSVSFVFVHAYVRVGYGSTYGAFSETAVQFKLPARLRK